MRKRHLRTRTRLLTTFAGLGLLSGAVAMPGIETLADLRSSDLAPIGAGVHDGAMTRPSTPEQVKAYFDRQDKTVLTFMGYSGAGYEDPESVRRAAEAILARHDPAKTIVNLGGTAEGIGSVYEIAKARGFATSGIVSTEAARTQTPLSPHVDTLFFVEDTSWGGMVDGRLSPTSEAMVAASDILVAIGGGEIARDELLAAKQRGKAVEFIPADMNHEAAIAKARTRDTPLPTDFRGAVHEAFGK
jgi:hypothetical protein